MNSPLLTLRRMSAIGIAAFVICGLLFPQAARAGKRVERPFKAQGQATILLNPTDLTWTKTHSGVATHGGLYAGGGSGNVLGGGGTVTCANRDTIDWTVVFTAVDLDFASMTATIEGVITWESGTGRFADVGGTASLEYQGTMEFTATGMIKLTLTYEINGTLTY